MDGVLHAMYMTKIKVTPLLLMTIVGAGAGVVSYQALNAQPPKQQEAVKPEAVAQIEDPSESAERLGAIALTVITPDNKVEAMVKGLNVDPKMKSVLKDRFDAAKTEVNARGKEYSAGRGWVHVYLDSSRRLLEAELDLSVKKADHVVAWETHRQRMQGIYEINLDRYNNGRISVQDLAVANYYRLDAEIGLERAKAQLKKSKESS
jgi:hypothetical protein